MKLIIGLFVLLISAKECDQNKTKLATNDVSAEAIVESQEMRLQEQKKINYRAATRGFYLQIWIEGDSIKYTKDYNLKDVKSNQLPKKEKEALLKLLTTTDAKSLPNLEIPSTTFQFDAKPMAYLELTQGDSIYRTNGFDHGKAPKSINALVEKILSIKEMVEKQ